VTCTQGTGFLPVSPQFPALQIDRDPWQTCRQPLHSHSIVSGTYKRLKQDDFLLARTQLTVRFAVKKCRLVPIDGDRWRTIPVAHIAGFTTIR
jgi:hypothetical protein